MKRATMAMWVGWIAIAALAGCGGGGGGDDGGGGGPPADVAGSWNGTTSGFGPDKNLSYNCRLELNQNGSDVSGSYTINLSVLSVSGVVEGNHVVLRGEDTMTRVLELEADGNAMSGTETYSGGGSFEVSVSLTR